jgi:hypothetical protein
MSLGVTGRGGMLCTAERPFMGCHSAGRERTAFIQKRWPLKAQYFGSYMDQMVTMWVKE